MSSSPIAAFAAGLRRPSATRAITRCPCGPQAKAVEVQATASIEQAPSRTARVAIIGATSLDGRIDEEGGPAARGGTGRSPRFECLDDHVTTDKPTISRPAGGRKLAPGGRLLATSEDSPNSPISSLPSGAPMAAGQTTPLVLCSSVNIGSPAGRCITPVRCSPGLNTIAHLESPKRKTPGGWRRSLVPTRDKRRDGLFQALEVCLQQRL